MWNMVPWYIKFQWIISGLGTLHMGAKTKVTRSGPKIPAAGHLEGGDFLGYDVWLNWTHFGR